MALRTNTFFRIGGCSGSYPTPTENRLAYDSEAPWGIRREPFRREVHGSRTTCFLLRHQNTIIIIDNGLGIEPVSEFVADMLDAEGQNGTVVHNLQTHFHEDHIAGIQSNMLLFRKGGHVRFYSPELGPYRAGDAESWMPGRPMMEEVLETYFRESNWPVTLEMLDEIGAGREHVQFHPGQRFMIDEIKVVTFPLEHPGGCCGFRFEIPRVGIIVVATDFEPPADPDPAVAEFFAGAKLLIADMQYRDQEYDGTQPLGRIGMSRVGWGHGCPSRLLPQILKCQRMPARVRIVHHDPKRSDTGLRMFYEETVNLLQQWGSAGAFNFQFAHDGDVFWF